MLLVAHAELEVLPRIIVDLEVAVDLGPGFRVLHVDVLIAENPAEGDRHAARVGVVLIGVAKIEARAAADAVQLVAAPVPSPGGFGYVLLGGFAVAPRVAHLAEEGQRVAGIPGVIQIDEIGGGVFVRPGNLVVDAIDPCPRPAQSSPRSGCCPQPCSPEAVLGPRPH